MFVGCWMTMIFNEILWVHLLSTDSICNVDYLKNNLYLYLKSNNNNITPKTPN